MDSLSLLNTILGSVNLLFLLKVMFNDLHALRDLLEKHLDFSEKLHREQENRLSILESQRPADK